MLSKYRIAMGTNEFLLGDFTYLALYTIETTNEIPCIGYFLSIHHENGKD